MNNTPNTPAELTAKLDAAREELAVQHSNRAILGAELLTATDEENRVRALVKSRDVAASELAKPQSSARNLRELIAEMDTEIAALESDARRFETDIATAQHLADMVAVAARADEAARRFHTRMNAVCEAFESEHPELRQARDDWARARSEFQTLGLREISRRPALADRATVERDGRTIQVSRPTMGMGATHDAQLAGAVALLREIAEAGGNTENVWATLPTVKQGTGNVPVSDVELKSPWARALMEVFENNGAVILSHAWAK